jgi:hypothetical protein
LPAQGLGIYWTFTSSSFVTGQQTAVNLKLFPDILIFYIFIYVVSLFAYVSHVYHPLQILMERRILYPRFNITLGEMLFVSITAIMVGGEFAYWYRQHVYEYIYPVIRSTQEIAARSMGQVSNILMGLLVLPVSKNSVWFYVFNISWEQAIKYHKWLAYSFLLSVLIHAMLWWNVFSVFPNVFSLNVLTYPMQYHADNFTNPLAQILSILMFFFMGIMSYHRIRRWNYDLFYYSHHFFVVVFLMVLWHAVGHLH